MQLQTAANSKVQQCTAMRQQSYLRVEEESKEGCASCLCLLHLANIQCSLCCNHVWAACSRGRAARPHHAAAARLQLWVQSCASSVVLPGLGMFSEARLVCKLFTLSSACSACTAPSHALLRDTPQHVCTQHRVGVPYVGRLRQAYFIFAIGNLRPIFDVLYADCYKTHTACSRALVASQTDTQARNTSARKQAGAVL